MHKQCFQRKHEGCMLVCKVEKRCSTQQTVSLDLYVQRSIVFWIERSADSVEAILSLSTTC